MRVVVVGAGIIGVTTAWELARDGHQVTVFERGISVAGETSFANAGIVAPGYVTPWAAPGMPGTVLGQLASRHAAVRVGSRIDATTLRWLWRWWRACRPARYAVNRMSMQRLALFSRDRLHAITHELQLEYERADGVLVLLRGERELELARPGLSLLAELGTSFRLVDAAQCRRIEPGLNPDTPLHAGVHLPDDEVGNCREFAHRLREHAQCRGVEFRFRSEVGSITPGPRPRVELLSAGATAASQRGERESAAFDAVVVCAALGSLPLLRPLGLRLPMVAISGYSITLPLRHHEQYPESAPRSAMIDERYKVAISRMGNRMRIAGSAELGAAPDRLHPGAIATLHKVLHDWFPGITVNLHAQNWKGARPMLPDGPPVIGASGSPGIWLNLGHGSSGWALACGSARLLADAVAGRPAAIDTEGFRVARVL